MSLIDVFYMPIKRERETDRQTNPQEVGVCVLGHSLFEVANTNAIAFFPSICISDPRISYISVIAIIILQNYVQTTILEGRWGGTRGICMSLTPNIQTYHAKVTII